jgi:zeaxanthin glucosyltransferase
MFRGKMTGTRLQGEMVHFAVIAPALAGHWNPMSALAAELVGRGHRASFLHLPSAARLLRDTRLEFHPVGPASPVDYAARMAERAGRAGMLTGVRGLIRDSAALTGVLCDELPGALTAIGAEAVLADQLEPAGGLVARYLGLPFVSVANALLIDRDPDVPPPFTGWRYREGTLARWRNWGGWWVQDALMRPINREIAARARGWGFAAGSMEECFSPVARISQTVAGFDFPRARAPSGLHHVGPLRGEAGHMDKPPGGMGLVYASLGTLQGGRGWIFRAIATACARKKLRLVIAHGGQLSAREALDLPGAPELHDFVSQRGLMPDVDAVVTHGGLNTTLDALAAGKPVIAIPLAFEQGAIAARLVHSGAGVAIGTRWLTASRLEGALEVVLNTPGPRAAAGRLAREIATAGGVRLGADIVEEAIRPALARAA